MLLHEQSPLGGNSTNFYCGIYLNGKQSIVHVGDLQQKFSRAMPFQDRNEIDVIVDKLYEDVCENRRKFGVKVPDPKFLAYRFNATCLLYTDTHRKDEQRWCSDQIEFFSNRVSTRRIEIMHESEATLLTYQRVFKRKLDAVIFLGSDASFKIVPKSEKNDESVQFDSANFSNVGGLRWIAKHAISKLRLLDEHLPQNASGIRLSESIETLCKKSFSTVKSLDDWLDYARHPSFDEKLTQFGKLLVQNVAKDEWIRNVFHDAGKAIGEIVCNAIVTKPFASEIAKKRRTLRIMFIGTSNGKWLIEGIRDRMMEEEMVSEVKLYLRNEPPRVEALAMAAHMDNRIIKRQLPIRVPFSAVYARVPRTKSKEEQDEPEEEEDTFLMFDENEEPADEIMPQVDEGVQRDQDDPESVPMPQVDEEVVGDEDEPMD